MISMLNCAFSHDARAKGSKRQVWMKVVHFQHAEEWGRTWKGHWVYSRLFPSECSSEDSLGIWMGSDLSTYFFLLGERLVAMPPRQTVQSICSTAQTWKIEIIYLPFCPHSVCLSMPAVVWGCILLPCPQRVETKAFWNWCCFGPTVRKQIQNRPASILSIFACPLSHCC